MHNHTNNTNNIQQGNSININSQQNNFQGKLILN